MDVLTDVIQMIGIKIQMQGCVTVNGLSPDSAAAGGAVFTTCHGRVRVVHSVAGTIDLNAGEALFLMGGRVSLSHVAGGEECTEVVVGRIGFAAGLVNLEMIGWPTVFRLGAADDEGGLVGRLVGEAREARPGWEAAGAALVTTLLVAAIRSYRPPDSECPARGWIRGLADPEIGPVLRLMHERPAHPWTVAALADQLSISRSGFAARFKQVTGRPPLAYLTWWRLCRAAARLRRRDGATVAQVARDIGYETEAAFGKAFRRQFGRTPGQVRQEGGGPRRATALQAEIKKQNPFDVREQEVALNLLRSTAKLTGQFNALFDAHGLLGSQYNVLRILRGASTALPRSEVRSRLVVGDDTFDSSVSALVSAGLVESDALQVLRLASKGSELLATLDGPVVDLHRRQLAHFSAEELSELNRLLVKVRRPDH